MLKHSISWCSFTTLACKSQLIMLQIILLSHLQSLLSDQPVLSAFTTKLLHRWRDRNRAPLNPHQPQHKPRIGMINICIANLHVFLNVCTNQRKFSKLLHSVLLREQPLPASSSCPGAWWPDAVLWGSPLQLQTLRTTSSSCHCFSLMASISIWPTSFKPTSKPFHFLST